MIFVCKIITIPNTEFIAKVFELTDSEIPCKISELQRESAHHRLPPVYQKLVGWAGLWITNMNEPRKQFSWSGNDEKEGFLKLTNALNTYKDFGLVQHNARTDFLPLLSYLSLKYQHPLPGRLYHHDLRYRYSRHNIDIAEELSNYGSSAYPGLKELAYLTGLPDVAVSHQEEIQQMAESGLFEQLETAAYNDVMIIYLLWVQMCYSSGELSEDSFLNLKQRAVQKYVEIKEVLNKK